MQVLSWAPHRPGLVQASCVAWREVRDADLTPDLDVSTWLTREAESEGLGDAVVFLTSRDLARHHISTHGEGAAKVSCLATVGLGNAERVGARTGQSNGVVGTINILATIHSGLSVPAMIEAVSIAAEARTLAVLESGRVLPPGAATGTGTDCIAIAAPSGDAQFAGKHTEIGEALGQAVYQAVSAGAAEWMRENG